MGLALAVMGKYHLPLWLQAAIAASGGIGLFILAFLDSTFLPFPSLNDLLLVDLSIQNPLRMSYYAGMSTVGSVLGCLLLFVLAKKGDEAAFHERAGDHAPRIRRWIERHGFLAMIVGALLPPPTPFKIFVMAAGALGMQLRTFMLAMVIARGIRFYVEGYLAIRYGPQAVGFFMAHKFSFATGTLISVVAFYVLVRLLFPTRQAAA
jgi:membrane protein YqaA with SNARE-associated domain